MTRAKTMIRLAGAGIAAVVVASATTAHTAQVHDGTVAGQNLLQGSQVALDILNDETTARQLLRECVGDQVTDISDEVADAALDKEPDPLIDQEVRARADRHLTDEAYSTRWGYGIFTKQPELTESVTEANAKMGSVAIQPGHSETVLSTLSVGTANLLTTCGDDVVEKNIDHAAFDEFLDKEDTYEKAIAQFAADPQHIAANTEWAACMAHKGFAYKTPLEAYLKFHNTALDVVATKVDAAPTSIVSEEVRTATAAATCGGATRDFLNDSNKLIWHNIAQQHGL